MDFHLAQAVAAAAQKEAELTAAHHHERTTAIAAIEGTHEETLLCERRKSIQSLATAETRHTEAVARTKAKLRKKADRAAREAADKAESAERSRSKKRVKKLREKHRRKLVEAERRAGRRALAQHVSSLQARVLTNAYPGSCFSCGQGFGLFTRQHHCRGCGMAVCDACSEHRIGMKNLRLSQAQWDAMCDGDTRLADAAADKWATAADDAAANALLPDDLRCCNACYGNRDMLRLGQADEVADEALFNYDEAAAADSDGGASSYAASRSSRGGARLSSLNEFF